MQATITERMCVVALDAYWGPRRYVAHKKQKWSDKELEGMHDAIKAALELVDPLTNGYEV